MQRISTTVVAVVGHEPARTLDELEAAANVRVVMPDRDAATLARAIEAWRAAARIHAPYAAHDADPLADVAAAWTGYYDRRDPLGTLEVAAAEVVRRWRAGTVELPDYYLVVDPDELDPTTRHWYLGYLHAAAPMRVVPVASAPGAATDALKHLHASRWWPDLDRLLDGVEAVVPDHVGVAEVDTSAS